MAYSFKENSYFQIKNKKEEEEIKKKAAAENLKRTAAMANVKPKQGPMPSSAPRITTKYPTLQKIADTNFNAPRRESLLTGLMESTGINPRKRETRESLAKPYSGEVEADRNAKRVMLPQVAASPLLRNALRDMGKNDLLFDIYEERDRQKNQKPKFTGIEMPQSIQRAFPISEDDRRKELERARLINSSSISPADKLKLLRENKDLTAEGAAVRGVAREADELDNLKAKYKGISSKHELRAIIEEYDKAYEEIRNTVTGGTGKEIYMSASREVVPELMEFYENYPKEREKLVAELEASERAEQIQKNQETYSDYIRSKTETKENPNFGKFFSGYDENGKMKFGSDYVPLWTGNTLIDNFISAEGKQKGGAEGEYQKAISLNRYFENELKPLVKLYEDMGKDPVFAKRIQQKYQTDSEYRKWIDGKQKTLEYYKGVLPKLENNYDKAISELQKKYNEDYKKAVMGEGAYEEEKLRRQAMGIVDFSEAAKRGKQKALENGGYLIGGENPEEVAPEKYARYRIDEKMLAAEAQFTETERAIYYALLDKNKTDASKYYDLLTKRYIAKNYNDTFEKAVSALEKNELTHGLGMVATTLIKPIESVLDIITLGGLENKFVTELDERLKADNTRGIQKQLGDTAGEYVAGAGHTTGEMLGAMITAEGLGLPIGSGASKVMISNAASSGMTGAKERGGNKLQQIGSGISAATAEWLFNKIGTDKLLGMIGKGSQSILKELIKSGANEFVEESLTEVANFLSDKAIMGDKSNFDLYKKSLISNGMSEEEAKKEALRQFLVTNPLKAGTIAAISGAALGGGNAFISTYAEGKNALTNAPEFQKFTEDIAKLDVSDYTGDAAKLQDAVKTYVEKIENAQTDFGRILNAGKAMSAASEFQGTPKVIATEDIGKEDRDYLNKFSKGAGVNILYTTIPQDMESGYKGGFFVEGTNTLVVDRGTSAIDMLKQTVAHEMSHATEGTRWFDAYKRSAIRDIEGIEGKSFNALVQEKRDFYRANGVEPKDAEAEVIADYTAKLFDDHNLIDKMVKRDYNTASLLLDGVKDIYNNLKTKFTGKEIGGVEETVRYLERALGMRNLDSGDSNTNLQYSINGHEKYDYTKSFEEQLDDWQNNKIPQYDSLLVRGTPETFQKIGFSPLPVTINQEHIDYAINNTKDIDHYITIGVLKQLPEALENPIAIIKSETVSDRVVAILSLKNPHNGKTIIVPVEIEGNGRLNDKRIDTNAIVSMFGKGNIIKQLENAIKTDSITDNKLFYWNKKEAISLLQRAGLQLPGGLPQDGFIHSITDTGSNVNKKIKNVTETKQFKRWFGKSKFVNEDDTPKELYHGTSRFGFTTFDLSKMDDKSTIFLADTPELASTYSGVEGVRKLKDVYGKDIEGMTMEELAKELTENSTKWNSPEESEGGTTYTVYNFQKQNELIDTVNEEIKKLSDFVDEKLVEFDRVSNLTDEEIRTRIEEELKGLGTDKENSEFLQKSKYKYYTEGIPKIKKRLETLKEDLKNYNYDKLSTPIYYLLHYTAVIPSENMGEVATLEKNIRLMNKLRKADISDGIIVEEALGGYHIELLDKKKAVSELRSEVSRGNYALYAKSENPLIVDAKGHFWNDIRGWTEGLFPPLENVEVSKDENEFYLVNKITGEKIPGADVAINSFTEEMSENKLKSFLARNAKNMAAIKYESKNTTREIAKIAKEFGFDGVMFKDIVDSGGKSNNIKYDQLKSNVYVVFSPKQVKSATDNIGTFDAENDDIRYSIQNLTPEQQKAIDDDRAVSEFYKNTLNNEMNMLTDEVREGLNEEDFLYEVKSNAQNYAEAKAYVNEMGFDKAKEMLEDKFRRATPLTSNEVAQCEYIVSQLQQQKRTSDAVNFIIDMRASLTEGGRAIQIISLFNRLTPEGQLLYLNKTAQKITDTEIERTLKGKRREAFEKEFKEAKKKDAEIKKRLDTIIKNYEDMGDVAALMELSPEEFKSRMSEMRKDIEGINEEVKKKSNKITEATDTLRELENERDSLKSKEKEARNLDRRIESLEKKISTMEESAPDIEEKNAELQKLREERDNLKKEKRKYETTQKRIAQLEEKIAKLDSEIADFDDKRKLLESYREVRDILKKEKSKYETVIERIGKVEQKIDEIKEQIADFESRRSELEEKRRKMTMFGKELNALKKEFKLTNTEEVYKKYKIDFLSKKDQEFYAEAFKVLDEIESPGELIMFIKAQNERRGITFSSSLLRNLEKAVKRGQIAYLKETALLQIMRSVDDMAKTSTFAKLMAWRMQSMLSGFPTFMRNIGSNTGFGAQESLVTNLAMPGDLLISAFTKQRSISWDNFGLGKGQLRAMNDARRESAIAIGTDTQRGNNKHELGRKAAFKNRGFAAFERHIAHALQDIDQWNEGGIKLNVTKQLERLREANKLDITDEEIAEIAQETANYRLFKDENLVNSIISGIKKQLNKVGIKDKTGATVLGLGDFVAPFVMVPGSIVCRTIEYTPFGYLKAIENLVDLAKARGDDVSAQRNLALSTTRATTGSGLIMLFAWLSSLGLIVGDKKDDTEEKKMQNITKSQGFTGYQLNGSALKRFVTAIAKQEDLKSACTPKDGDFPVKFDFFQPLANNMAVGYGLYEAVKEAEENGKDVNFGKFTFDASVITMAKFFDQIEETSGFSFVKRIFDDSLDETDTIITIGADVLTSFLPRQISQTARMMDTTQRSAYLEKDPWKKFGYMVADDIPGLRSKVPAKTSHFGEELDSSLGNPVVDFFNIFMNPGTANKYKTDAVTDEVVRVYKATNENGVLPPNLSKGKEINFGEGIKKEIYGLELTDYSKKIGSAIAEEYKTFIESEEYKKLSDEERAKCFKSLQGGIEEKKKVEYATEHNIYPNAKTKNIASISADSTLYSARWEAYPDDVNNRYSLSLASGVAKYMKSLNKRDKLNDSLSDDINTQYAELIADGNPPIYQTIYENCKKAEDYLPLNLNYSSVFSWENKGIKYEMPTDDKVLKNIIKEYTYDVLINYKDLYENGYYTEKGKLGKVEDKNGNMIYATWDNMVPAQRNSKLASYKTNAKKFLQMVIFEVFYEQGIEPTIVDSIWEEDEEGEE